MSYVTKQHVPPHILNSFVRSQEKKESLIYSTNLTETRRDGGTSENSGGQAVTQGLLVAQICF